MEMTVDRERGQHSSRSAARLTVVVAGDERWRWIERDTSAQLQIHDKANDGERKRDDAGTAQICGEANGDGGGVDGR
ncbi:hypothetical protein A2U01_0027424 [Trifolium medium]|uniref:Uncharacterized protein n=1 Tax=Trifolium medium TaxID=97028 RepID=A0A392P699_9FABA|nr:hypothetical protein [Trifolium medium]